MLDLTKVCRETRRVLRPGGKFIHFQDIMPYPGIVMDKLSKDEVAFPLFGINQKDDLTILGLQIIPKSDFEAKR